MHNQTKAEQTLESAYDIKNVDIRNLLTVVVGTLNNQTGESFDSALSKGKCADEILRRFNEFAKLQSAVIQLRQAWIAPHKYPINKAEMNLVQVSSQIDV